MVIELGIKLSVTLVESEFLVQLTKIDFSSLELSLMHMQLTPTL